ncbi:flagellar brake protein [Sideroxydans lithotrophicus]|uniref:Flagellar brake protein YcgR n=1 Tax=Sideroxydans lithotrophicus (strain ES-1) TaxID=580332 RepID=D5CQP7_SIDLE|nr:flagellar brake protein [Sideroxydans lithotrophicus]ADE11283.1 type IV pilus assembly PilZ [Sideroxydans lithotrophicus ES-1]
MTNHPEESQFALHNRKEIVFILEDLAKHRVAINLDTSEGVGLVTSVLGVSSEGNYVYMDVSPDDRINEKITHSKHVSFVTQAGVKVRWHATHLHLVELQDGNAFSMLVPSVIERIQRREYFRLSTPQGSKALICRIPSGTAVIEAIIADMSLGGIGIVIRGALHEVFTHGALLEGCTMELPVIGVVPMNLRVRGIWTSMKTKSGEQLHRLGLEFEGLSRGASNVIQRYMIQLEAERISLS